MYRSFFKRIFDFTAALVGLVVLLPFLLVVAGLLAIANKGKVVFVQPRPGKNGKIFRVIKFKTMSDKKDSKGNLAPDAERLTSFGKFLRSTSIDELPQLFNVLQGNMSLIGPRPLKTHNLLLYTPEQARRHNVRPGITGWAQVNGRNNLLLSQKFKHDVWYVDNLTFFLDIKIIFLTIKNVLSRKNVGEGSTCMNEVDDLHFMERLKEIYKNQNNLIK